MPIESNRINKECPDCKNSTMFDTGKEFFCAKCLKTMSKKTEIDSNLETLQTDTDIVGVEQ